MIVRIIVRCTLHVAHCMLHIRLWVLFLESFSISSVALRPAVFTCHSRKLKDGRGKVIGLLAAFSHGSSFHPSPHGSHFQDSPTSSATPTLKHFNTPFSSDSYGALVV